jgi:hypothetical protein
VGLVANDDVDPTGDRMIEQRHKRRMTGDQVLVAHDRGVLRLAAAVPEPLAIGSIRSRALQEREGRRFAAAPDIDQEPDRRGGVAGEWRVFFIEHLYDDAGEQSKRRVHPVVARVGGRCDVGYPGEGEFDCASV